MYDAEYQETVKNMRKRTTRLEREGDYWTDEEKRQLEVLFGQGVGITEIAVRLQRTEPAVIQQIEKGDLYGRKSKPKRNKKQKSPQCLCERCECAEGCSWRDGQCQLNEEDTCHV